MACVTLSSVEYLVLVDVSDPALPKRLAGHSWPDIAAPAVALSGDRVYLVGNHYAEAHEASASQGTLLALDIADSANPQEVGRYMQLGSDI